MKNIVNKHVNAWRNSGVDFYTNQPAAIIVINLLIQRVGAMVLGIVVTCGVIYTCDKIHNKIVDNQINKQHLYS